MGVNDEVDRVNSFCQREREMGIKQVGVMLGDNEIVVDMTVRGDTETGICSNVISFNTGVLPRMSEGFPSFFSL